MLNSYPVIKTNGFSVDYDLVVVVHAPVGNPGNIYSAKLGVFAEFLERYCVEIYYVILLYLQCFSGYTDDDEFLFSKILFDTILETMDVILEDIEEELSDSGIDARDSLYSELYTEICEMTNGGGMYLLSYIEGHLPIFRRFFSGINLPLDFGVHNAEFKVDGDTVTYFIAELGSNGEKPGEYSEMERPQLFDKLLNERIGRSTNPLRF